MNTILKIDFRLHPELMTVLQAADLKDDHLFGQLLHISDDEKTGRRCATVTEGHVLHVFEAMQALKDFEPGDYIIHKVLKNEAEVTQRTEKEWLSSFQYPNTKLITDGTFEKGIECTFGGPKDINTQVTIGQIIKYLPEDCTLNLLYIRPLYNAEWQMDLGPEGAITRFTKQYPSGRHENKSLVIYIATIKSNH